MSLALYFWQVIKGRFSDSSQMEIKWQLWVHNGLQHSGKHRGSRGSGRGQLYWYYKPIWCTSAYLTSAKTSSEALHRDQLLDTESTLPCLCVLPKLPPITFIGRYQLIYVPYSREGPDVGSAVADFKGVHKYRKLSEDKRNVRSILQFEKLIVLY